MNEQDTFAGSAVGTWVSLGDPAIGEILAPEFEFVVFDTEHTPNGLETVTDSVRAIDAAPGETLSLARVPWNDPIRIKRLLDTGVGGVIVPMIETEEEARAAVAACRYPPEGVRWMAAARASGYGRTFESYVEGAKEEIETVLQIETERGVGNAAAIAAVDGVDALLVGPADLSSNLGVRGEWSDERFVGAVESVLEAAHEAGTPVGTLAIDADQLRTFGAFAFDFMITGVDAALLRAGAQRLHGIADEVL